MSGFPIIDLVAGLVFIYFLLSIICSSALEIVLTMGKYRAKMLERWLTEIFSMPVTLHTGTKVKLGQAILDHCSVTALSKPGKSNAYMDAKNFVSALLEKITFDPANPQSITTELTEFEAKIQATTSLPVDLKRLLLNYANEAKKAYESSLKLISEIDLFKNKIEYWYDSNMDRVGGALKTKYARPFTFWITVVIVFALNADSITIAGYLYSNPDARAKIAAQAYKEAADSTELKKNIAQALKRTNELKSDSLTVQKVTNVIKSEYSHAKELQVSLEETIPLGWQANMFQNKSTGKILLFIFLKLVGLSVSVLAVMMGAPFWFEVLNKIASVRGNGQKPGESNRPSKPAK